jgi:hypothetical protein
MKKVTFLLIAVSLLLSVNLLADEPNVIMQRETGGELTIAIGLATAGDIQVDWGDGVLVSGTAGTTNATANITGTVIGTNTIKLYGPITTLQVTNSGSTTLITSVNVSNAPELVKFVFPRNKLTAVDLSNNLLVRTISIYNNLLDACAMDGFFTSLPTITNAGSITPYNNPGHLTSKTSIALDKGWSIYNNQFGDGTGCTTAINSVIEAENIFVNYSNSNLYVNGANLSGEFELYVMSLNGKKITQKTIELDATGKSVVQLNNLPMGMYFVNVKGNNKNFASKFVVQ